MIEGTVAALFLQEIDEIMYTAFLPAEEIATVIEFETPIYSKIYTLASAAESSQRYRTNSRYLRILQRLFSMDVALAFLVFMYTGGLTYALVWIPVFDHCQDGSDTLITADDNDIPIDLITNATLVTLNATNATLAAVVNASIAAISNASNATNTTI